MNEGRGRRRARREARRHSAASHNQKRWSTKHTEGSVVTLVRQQQFHLQVALDFLGALAGGFGRIQREIVYRILRTPQGERLRAIATTGDLSHRTARAIAWLRANYAKPLRIDELAEAARMGVSTLHHQFRALTAMSPLQYQKQLRLQMARQRMLMDGLDATSAAYEVGYESVSQFTREYSRLFGQPPMRDVKSLRDSNVVPISAA